MLDGNSKIRVLIAASGSGGHIFPALFVARAFKEKIKEKRGRDLEIQFVGAGRALDAKLIEGAGYKLNVISTSGITGLGVKGILTFLLKMPVTLAKTIKLIRELKPDLIMGFGGYVTVYPVTVGAIFGIPTWIHEAEASPGLANKFLSIFASRISTAFDGTSFPKSKTVVTGHPIRSEIKLVHPINVSGDAPSNLLVLGGSQGSNSLDNILIELAPFLKEKKVNLLHQCRPENKEKVAIAYKSHDINATVLPFITDMTEAYNFSHIVISRSGAGSVAEISAINRPAIFVPLPSSQGGHQLVNAKALSDIKKALIVTEGEGFKERLMKALDELLDLKNYNEYFSRSGRNISVDAAESIAEGCLKLIDDFVDQRL